MLFYINYYALRAARAVSRSAAGDGTFDARLCRYCMPARKNVFVRPERVVQVVGIPRSGTTLVGALLGAHRRTLSLIEPFLSYVKNGSFAWTDASGAGRVCFRPPLRFINRVTSGVGGKDLLAFKETWRNERQDYFPNSDFIRRNAEGGVRTIAVLRDPRAIWRSFVRRPGTEYEGAPGDAFVSNWNSYCEWMVEQKLFCVRYEDLMLQPDAETGRLFSYLGLPSLEKPIRLACVYGHGDERGQSGEAIAPRFSDVDEGLAPQVSRTILDSCGGWMRRLGYLR